MGKASKKKALRREGAAGEVSPAVEQRRAKAAARQPVFELEVDEDALSERISQASPERLPYLYLAMWHLAQTPVRNVNQCLFASVVLAEAFKSFGVKADLVALELKLPSANVSYGTPEPRMVHNFVNGHVGILAGETFIDATAAQFKEIREVRGVVPFVGTIPDPGLVRNKGAELQFALGSNDTVTYRVHPAGSAARVRNEWMAANSNPTREIARHVSNLVQGFAWVVGALRGAIQTGLPILDQAIADSVQAASEGKDLQMVGGKFVVR